MDFKKIWLTIGDKMNWVEPDKTITKYETVEKIVEVPCTKPHNEPFNLSKFSSNRVYSVNGQSIKLNKHLNDKDEDYAADLWVDTHLDTDKTFDTADDVVRDTLLELYAFMGYRDTHVPEAQNKDHWKSFQEFIDDEYQGDCDDHAKFKHKIIVSRLIKAGFRKDINKLYLILCGLNNRDGFSIGNHASLLWQHTNGKYYVVESAVSNGSNMIEQSISSFGAGKDIRERFDYGRVVYMSNRHSNYYQVLF